MNNRKLRNILKEFISTISENDSSNTDINTYAVSEKSLSDEKSKHASDINKKLSTEKDPLNKLKLQKDYAISMIAKSDVDAKYNRKLSDGWKKIASETDNKIKLFSIQKNQQLISKQNTSSNQTHPQS